MTVELANVRAALRRLSQGLREWPVYRDRPATYTIAGAIHDLLLVLHIARPHEAPDEERVGVS